MRCDVTCSSTLYDHIAPHTTPQTLNIPSGDYLPVLRYHAVYIVLQLGLHGGEGGVDGLVVYCGVLRRISEIVCFSNDVSHT